MKAICPSLLFFCHFISGEAVGMEKSFRVVFPQQPKDTPEEVYLFDGTASKKIPLPGMNFSDVMRLPEGNLVLSMTAEAVTDAAAVSKDAPQANIPEAMINFYLVVLSEPGNTAMPMRMLPINAGDEHLKAGQTHWVNLTAHRIEADFGETSLTILPNENVVGAAPLQSNGYFKAKFRYQPKGSGDFLPVMEKSWWFDAQSKNLGFVFESDIGFPQIFTFRDQRDTVSK
jgi:hypothetical protein